MSKMPYICDFRFIIHVWDTEVDPLTQEVVEWTSPMHEDFMLETWRAGFNFLSKEEKENFQKIFTNRRERGDPIASEMADYGKESLANSDTISHIIEAYIKPKGEKFFEVTGKLHEHCYQDYEGDWDCETEVSDVEFQEVDEKDIDWLWKKV